MATRSTIAIKDGENIRSIYAHWDGYPSHNGKILLDNYNTTETVKDLIDGGDISVLKEDTNQTEYYGRDRKESGVGAQTTSAKDYKELHQEYNYLFDPDSQTWTVTGYEYDNTPLTKEICETD